MDFLTVNTDAAADDHEGPLIERKVHSASKSIATAVRRDVAD